MLKNEEIEKYKSIVEKYNKALATEEAMKEQLVVLKKQAQEILRKYGLKSMNDIQVLQAKLSDMEMHIKKSQEEMLEYIEKVNAKKEEKDRILLG
jgi:uncharacterized protein (DUF885 family)